MEMYFIQQLLGESSIKQTCRVNMERSWLCDDSEKPET